MNQNAQNDVLYLGLKTLIPLVQAWGHLPLHKLMCINKPWVLIDHTFV